jgi:hypothetical protein
MIDIPKNVDCENCKVNVNTSSDIQDISPRTAVLRKKYVDRLESYSSTRRKIKYLLHVEIWARV